ncbi:MAG: NAD+ synthase [Thermoplasmata archaeon]|nr:MAG: NAD+ synthase [Thermoplasmata archaeon]
MLEIDPEETTTIIVEFIRTYTEQAGKKSLVIGLSGGVDSAVVAKLATLALGKKNIHALFLPELSTPLKDFEHTSLIANELDLNYETIDISPLIYSIRRVCKHELNEIALGNIKARFRMLLLYEEANTRNSLVCGTSNKTELLIGYFTKYGDGGSDIMPIGDIYKTQVYQLAEYLNIPDVIIKKAPTAGLWKGQTDEGELGISYEKLDKILYGLEQKLPINLIAEMAGVDENEVKRIQGMRKRTEHKRRLPLIPKIGKRTVGWDWRSPVQQE